jgi:hemerythrin
MTNTTLNSVTWNDTMLVGYAPLDRVHQEFVLCIDAVLHASEAGMAAAMTALQAHTREHFQMEERWMEETTFPARGCHADEHGAVLRSVTEVCELVASGDARAVRPLMKALLEWFPAHADQMDSALAHWMCQRKHGGAPVVLRRGVIERAPAG